MALAGSTAHAQEDEAAVFRKLFQAQQEMFSTLPCHEILRGDAAFSYPAWIVTAGGPCRDGFCSPAAYQRQTFLNIEYQSYLPGQKTYFKPIIYHDREMSGDEWTTDQAGTFVGYVRYRVARIVQAYDPKIHDKWRPRAFERPFVIDDFVDINAAREFQIPRDSRALLPASPWTTQEAASHNSPYKFCLVNPALNNPLLRRPKCFIGYEMCYSSNAQPRQGLVSTVAPVFQKKFGTHYRYQKTGDEIPTPTYLGYETHFRDLVQRDTAVLDATLQGLYLIGQVLPDGGVTKLFQCADPEFRSPYCWYEFAAEATGELSGFLTHTGLLSALSKFKGGAAVADKIGNKAMYGALGINLGANATMATFYAKEGDWLSAAGSILESGTSLGVGLLVFRGGAAHYTPNYEIKGTCAKIPDLDVRLVERAPHAAGTCSRPLAATPEIATTLDRFWELAGPGGAMEVTGNLGHSYTQRSIPTIYEDMRNYLGEEAVFLSDGTLAVDLGKIPADGLPFGEPGSRRSAVEEVFYRLERTNQPGLTDLQISNEVGLARNAARYLREIDTNLSLEMATNFSPTGRWTGYHEWSHAVVPPGRTMSPVGGAKNDCRASIMRNLYRSPDGRVSIAESVDLAADDVFNREVIEVLTDRDGNDYLRFYFEKVRKIDGPDGVPRLERTGVEEKVVCSGCHAYPGIGQGGVAGAPPWIKSDKSLATINAMIGTIAAEPGTP